MSEEDLLKLLSDRLALSRLKRSQLSVKQQKILDNAVRYSQYKGFQVDNGAIIDSTGGITKKGLITNGLITPDSSVKILGQFADQRPRVNNPPKEVKAVKKLLQEMAILYKIKETQLGEKLCTFGNWYFNNGRCQQVCNLFDYGYATKQECIDATPLIHVARFGTGWEYRSESIRKKFNRIDFSFSGRIAVSTYDYVSPAFKVWGDQITEPRTFHLKLSVAAPPNLIFQGAAIGINRFPQVGYFGGSGFANFGFKPGTYDFLSGSASIELNITLSPGSYVFYLVSRCDTENFFDTRDEDSPYSGSVEFDISPPTITTPMNVFYLRSGSAGSDSMKVLELRQDDPFNYYLTKFSNKTKLYIKSGQKYQPSTEKVEWLKKEDITIIKDEKTQKTIVPPTLTTAVEDENWQATFIDSYETPEPASPNKCVEEYNDKQTNIVGNKAFTCDLDQQVNGLSLKNALIQDSQEVDVKLLEISPSDQICIIEREVLKTFSIEALDLPKDTKAKDVEIIAVSPIII